MHFNYKHNKISWSHGYGTTKELQIPLGQFICLFYALYLFSFAGNLFMTMEVNGMIIVPNLMIPIGLIYVYWHLKLTLINVMAGPKLGWSTLVS